MKRMIDYKEFKELQQLANNNEQRLDIDEQRLDHIEGAYTYSALSLDDANFDHLLPSAPEDFQPQTLEIGDTVYIEGVATTLDADMIKDIFDSNLVIIDCGSSPTSYPTLFLQRQYVDEESATVSPRNARFKAFVTYGVALYEFTMTVAEYDETSEEGGYIAISCKEASTKPIYYHPIFIRDNTTWARLTFVLIDNQAEPYTWTTFKTKVKSLMESGSSIQVNGVFTETQSGGKSCQAFILIKDSLTYRVFGFNEAANDQFYIRLDDLTATVFEDGVNRIN